MNALVELLGHIEDRKVKHVHISFDQSYGKNIMTIHGSLEEVTTCLNFCYDDGFGGQEITGYIWYEDGTWSDRGEYDGSEWWQHQVRPEIPEYKIDEPETK